MSALPAAEEPLSRALALHRRGELAAAELNYRRALAAEPQHLDALNLLGVLMLQQGRAAQALERFDAALTLKPDFVAALTHRGEALRALGRAQEAVASLEQAVAVRPDYAPAHNNLAAALLTLARPAAALARLDVALALDPLAFEALSLRAVALEDLGRLEEALAVVDRALKLKPDHAPAWNNAGVILRELGQFALARAAFARALALDAGAVEAEFNLATLALLMGDFAAGWPGYEARWRRAGAPLRLQAAFPPWRGENLAGRALLVYTEQGAGDIIQFSRYLRLAQDAGAEVSLLAPPSLSALLARLCPGARVLTPPPTDAPFDYHAPIASLPGLFATRLDTIPPPTPPLPDLQREAMWRARLGAQGFRIGIAWQGARRGKVDVGRSIPLAAFAPLARRPGVRLISLQKNDGVEQLAFLPEGMTVETLGEDFDAGPDAFLDSAAVMAALDLVVTSDTAIAHLAGALGRPVWVALKHAPDWRWLTDRADSPWYPAMRLFRQPARGEWAPVFARMAGEIVAGPCAR